MRAAIYTRISQDATGKKAGVTRQLKECRGLARRLRWQVVDTFDDNDISAYNGKTRPGFEAMLDAIKQGRIDAVICWHPDRLYRRTKDLERLVDIADAGVQIRSVNGGDLDLSNSTGKMMARILGSVAQQESEHKGERRRAANADRAANGEWRADGARIFGYTQRGEPLEPEAAAVRQAATDVLDGRSLRSIATDWNGRGLLSSRGKGWSNLTLRRVLMNPTYAGLRTYRGTVVGSGTWERLIDPDTHHGLVAFLSDESRRPQSSFERKHTGSGVYVCGVCGEPLFATGPGGQPWPGVFVPGVARCACGASGRAAGRTRRDDRVEDPVRRRCRRAATPARGRRCGGVACQTKRPAGQDESTVGDVRRR